MRSLELAGNLPYITAMSAATKNTDTWQSSKKERLEARLTAEQKAVIERAAVIEGRSVSDFVTSAAVNAAARAIEAHENMRLSLHDAETFAEALLTPGEPNRALREAARAHRKLCGAGE